MVSWWSLRTYPTACPKSLRGLKACQRGMRACQRGLRACQMGQRACEEAQEGDGRMDGRCFSPFYSTLSPVVAAAQKGGKRNR